MNSPEQAFLKSISDALENGAATKLRLVPSRPAPESPMSTLKNKVSRCAYPVKLGEAAEYLAVGAQVFQDILPIGFLEAQTAQMIADGVWSARLHEKLQQHVTCPKSRAILDRCIKRSQSSNKGLAARLASEQKKRLRASKVPATLETCQSYQWYAMMAELAAQLTSAREELEEKSSVRANQTLRLLEPLSAESIEVISESYRQGLLTEIESTLFQGLARAS